MGLIRRGKKVRHAKTRTSQVKKNQRAISKINSGIERKYFLGDIVADFPVAGSGLVTWLTAITIGDDNNQREGLQVSGVKFEINYNLNFDTVSVHPFETCRVMLFERIRSNQDPALPNAADILSVINPHAYIDRSLARPNFRILMDRVHVLNRLAVLAVDSVTPRYTFTKYLRGRKMTFNGQTPVPASGVGGEGNHIFLLMVTDATANEANFVGSSQYTYTDQ